MGQRQVSQNFRAVHSQFTELIASSFSALEETTTAPDTLFHFTDCDGLIGVLKSRALWASLANALNDKSELQYGRELVGSLVTRREITTKHLSLSGLSDALERQSWRVFVISFCARIDTALQWLHYGRSGSGVALGFRSALLEQPGYRLYPVEYMKPRQIELMAQAVHSIDDAFGKTSATLATIADKELLESVALDSLAARLWSLLPRMKDQSFAAEQEWRLVASVPVGAGGPLATTPWGPTYFKSRMGRIIPYKELKFDVLPIVGIVEGASSLTQQDPMTLRVLLESTLPNSGDLELSVSPVPVRP